MAEDWDEKLDHDPIEERRSQAGRLMAQPSAVLWRSRDEARRSLTDLGPPPGHRDERRYFEGFIARLEEELRCAAAGEPAAASPRGLESDSGGKAEGLNTSGLPAKYVVSIDDGFDPVARFRVQNEPPPDLPLAPEFTPPVLPDIFLQEWKEPKPRARPPAGPAAPAGLANAAGMPGLPNFLVEGWIEESEKVCGPKAAPSAPVAPLIPERFLDLVTESAPDKKARNQLLPLPREQGTSPLPDLFLKPMDEGLNGPRHGPSSDGVEAAPEMPAVAIYRLPDENPGVFRAFFAYAIHQLREAFRKPERIRYEEWED